MNKLRVVSSQSSGSRKGSKHDLSPEQYAHFMELLAEHVSDPISGTGQDRVSEKAVMEMVDLSPEEHARFSELYNQVMADLGSGAGKKKSGSGEGLSPDQQAHFEELLNEHVPDSAHSDDSPDDHGPPYDNTVRFKPGGRFNVQHYMKKHRAEITRLQAQFPGSKQAKWYNARVTQAGIARVEVAALLNIIQEMEQSPGPHQSHVTDVGVAHRLLKVAGMRQQKEGKLPKGFFQYNNLLLPRVQEYINRVLALAGVHTSTRAVHLWRGVRANPEDRLMMHYMTGLIEYNIIRQNNEAMAKAKAAGEIV